MTELTGSQKLSILIDFLGGVPDDNYDQRIWGELRSCGSCGCAMGWGGMALGDKLGFIYDPATENFNLPDGTKFNGRAFNAEFETSEAFLLATRTFGMTLAEAEQAFGARASTRCEKIAELRKLVTVLEERERAG